MTQASTALALLVGVTGCHRDADRRRIDGALAALADSDNERALQRYFDAHPQCAQVLYTDDDTGVMYAQPDDPAAAALQAAGLIEPARVALSEQRVSYRPSAAARRWFTMGDQGVSREHLLCFAIRSVSLRTVTYNGTIPYLRYTFHLTGAPPWMRDKRIREAFPTVAASFGGEYLGEERLAVTDGKVALDGIKPTYQFYQLMLFGVEFNTRHRFVEAVARSGS